ncbi:unnamed protein product [Chondrus crispus]|uniref:HTH myb-type domain-containing protein n=1 Tax=Chondrus crispus TaxID=2769 RepID=R7QAS6_CHOCR|nr:unnamed protein product [Chondrus crispus]CDF34560.1 unnamed protein product [Chondrus crispus]|eukprot:XP_005714379.1 unnamed protein product [Chondrus crispus]
MTPPPPSRCLTESHSLVPCPTTTRTNSPSRLPSSQQTIHPAAKGPSPRPLPAAPRPYPHYPGPPRSLRTSTDTPAMCNFPRILDSDDIHASAATAAALAFTPPADLSKRATENQQRIGLLEELIRAEKLELSRLRAHNDSLQLPLPLPLPLHENYQRGPNPVPPSPQPSLNLATESFKAPHHQNRKFPTTPELTLRQISCALDSSPRGVMMQSFETPSHSPNINNMSDPNLASDTGMNRTLSCAEEESPQMAARGSHWSFAEKARFEAALQKYGPFVWDDIIFAVGTRTEKQVKAYAARYRRRKKLASRMEALFSDVAHQQRWQKDCQDARSQTETLESEVMVVDDSAFELPQGPSLLSETDNGSVESDKTETLMGTLSPHLTDPYSEETQPTCSDTSLLFPPALVGDSILIPGKRSTGAQTMSPAGGDLLIDRAFGEDGVIVGGDAVKTEQLVQISDDSMQADFLTCDRYYFLVLLSCWLRMIKYETPINEP